MPPSKAARPSKGAKASKATKAATRKRATTTAARAQDPAPATTETATAARAEDATSGATGAPGQQGLTEAEARGRTAGRPTAGAAPTQEAPPVELPVDVPATSSALVPVPRPPDPATEPGGDPRRRSDVDEWGRSESMRAFARKVYDPMYRRWFRVEWEGFENLPREGGGLLVANHAGAIPSDAPAIMHGIETELERPVYGLADEIFKKLPVVGTLWSRSGGVLAHPDNAYRLLREQQQLALVFPEGTKGTGKPYNERYQLRRFGRGGYVQIAMRAGVPIIPLAVVGAEESMPIIAKVPQLARLTGLPYVPITANMLAFGALLGPLGAALWFPAKIRIRVLPPIHLDVEPDQHRYSRSRIMDESENVRQQIQEALHDMLRQRRSVWFG
jgi:1-acyl-sn-glycerol-3-phosphate acyltransferase